MDKIKKLKQQLIDLIGANPNLPITGVVKSIENDTCTVEVLDELKLSDIRLKATADGNDYLLIIPEVGSSVLMLSSDGTVDNMTVIKVDKASKIIINNGLQIEIDSEEQKVCIKNDLVSLHDILKDLSTLLQQLKVYTPMGPSGTPLPDSITAIQKFETDFKKILK